MAEKVTCSSELNESDKNNFLKSFFCVCKDLRSVSLSNLEYYQHGKLGIHARYYAAFSILIEQLEQGVEPHITELVPQLQNFDLCPDVQANGYRSFVKITYRCCLHLLQLSRHIHVNKTSLLFRSIHYCKELEGYVECLTQLRACLYYLQRLVGYSRSGDLFVEEMDFPETADQLMLEVEMLNVDCFYGRCVGFQFCESIQKMMQAVLVVMASFSEGYQERYTLMQLASSLLNSGKYVVDQELRAKQIVNVTRTADIDFCKAFWSLPESLVLQQLRSLTFPHVQLSEEFSIPVDTFELPLEGVADETVTITPPCAHTGPAPVKVHLISYEIREGQDYQRQRLQPKTGSASPQVHPACRDLVFHCHGGGFVAQSPKAHESYLRRWAKELNCPIFSVDYSLAPEMPFPRALEECFFAYAWAVKNCHKLGWTGERVCFAGDSAGGNLCISTALRAASYGIKVPDGLMAAYTPVLIKYTPSPARLMAMIDPLLPVGILTRCLAAYSGIADKFSSALATPIFCDKHTDDLWDIISPEDVPKEKANENKDGKSSKLISDQNKEPCASNTTNIGETNDIKPSSSCAGSSLTKDVVSSSTSCEGVSSPESTVESESFKSCLSSPGTEGETEIVHLGENSPVILSLSGENDEHTTCNTGSEADQTKPSRHCDMVESVCDTVVAMETDVTDSNYDNLQQARVGKEVRKKGLLEQISVSDTSDSGVHDDMDQPDSCHGNQEVNRLQQFQESSVDSAQVLGDSEEEFEILACDSETEAQSEARPVPQSFQLEKSRSFNSVADTYQNVDFEGCNKETNKFDNQSTRSLTQSAEVANCANKTVSQSSEGADRSQLDLNLAPEVNSLPRSPSSPSLNATRNSKVFSPRMFPKSRKIGGSPMELFRRLPIVKNPYMSPILAPDDMMQGLPPVYLVACHLDPLLDDSVMLASRLRKLGKFVDLKVVDDLPHGFLNFGDASQEARKASKICLDDIKAVLKKS